MSIGVGGIIAFGFRGLNLIVAFGTVLFTAHLLSKDEYGLFALSLTVIGIANALTGGLTAATAYQIANQRRPAGLAFANGASIGGTIGILAVLAGIVGATALRGDAAGVALPVGLAAAAVIINSVTAGAFLGRESLVRYNVALVAPPLFALAAIAITFLTLDRRTPEAALGAYAAGQWLALGLMWVVGGKGLFAGLRLERALLQTILRFALLAGMSSGVSYLNYRADLFVVEHFEGKDGAGTYSLAVYLAESVWQVSGSLALAAYARMGTLDRAEAAHLTTRVMRHSLILLTLVCAVLFASAGLVESVAFSKYDGMAAALRFILPGVLVYGMAQAFSGFYTYRRGLPWVAALVAGGGLVIDIALDFVLIPAMGVSGAALASSIAYTVAITAGLAVFFRQEGIRPTTIFRVGRQDIEDYRVLANRLRSALTR
jgi:O-antigen/teichoic acid export membrane protein